MNWFYAIGILSFFHGLFYVMTNRNGVVKVGEADAASDERIAELKAATNTRRERIYGAIGIFFFLWSLCGYLLGLPEKNYFLAIVIVDISAIVGSVLIGIILGFLGGMRKVGARDGASNHSLNVKAITIISWIVDSTLIFIILYKHFIQHFVL